MQYLLNINDIAPQEKDSYFGGSSQISEEIELPKTTLQIENIITDRPKLLFSIAIKDLFDSVPEHSNNLFCSVFFSCDYENYEHISIMQDYYRDELVGSIVIIHERVKNYFDDAFVSPPKLLTIDKKDKKEPNWNQDPIEWKGYKYACEFDCLDIDKNFEKKGFFDGAIGYLFIKENWEINEPCGAFILQSR